MSNADEAMNQALVAGKVAMHAATTARAHELVFTALFDALREAGVLTPAAVARIFALAAERTVPPDSASGAEREAARVARLIIGEMAADCGDAPPPAAPAPRP